ncbi:MAG: hypothetical protein PQJ60_08690, partial [Spirochaetales bacterium]|nr:hypothetical protein [Spirochaetales bacterium]
GKHEELQKKVVHRTTNSQVFRNYQNKLFPCNYIDRQTRKDQAEYVRETVQFGRNMNNSMERYTCYSFWHNYIKPFRINKANEKTKYHAQRAGFSIGAIKEMVREVFKGIRPREKVAMEHLAEFQNRIWGRTLMNPLHPGAV